MSGAEAVFLFPFGPGTAKTVICTQTFYILEETKMKNNMMKKFLTMTLACAMTLSLAACGSKTEPPADTSDDQSTTEPADTEAKTYKVAIIKQLDHASLDEIANAIAAQLDQIAADNGVTIDYEITSGQNDQTTLKQLADQAIADGVDAIIPTDNVIMAAELAIYEDLAAAGIPHYTGADSFVRNGAFTTCGVNYTQLGAKTADLAYQAITEGMDGLEDYYLMDGGIITVNTETAAALGIDYSVFAGMGEVVEVTTTKD